MAAPSVSIGRAAAVVPRHRHQVAFGPSATSIAVANLFKLVCRALCLGAKKNAREGHKVR